MKQIIIDVSPEGELQIETSGYKGSSCVSETKFLKELLGKETMRSLTPCYYQNEKMNVKKYLPICG